MALSFELLKNCKPCELLRVKIEDAAEFAILGANEGHGVQALVVAGFSQRRLKFGAPERAPHKPSVI